MSLHLIHRQKLANVIPPPATPATRERAVQLVCLIRPEPSPQQVLDELCTIHNLKGCFCTMDLSSTSRLQLLDLSAKVTQLWQFFSDVVYHCELEATMWQ